MKLKAIRRMLIDAVIEDIEKSDTRDFDQRLAALGVNGSRQFPDGGKVGFVPGPLGALRIGYLGDHPDRRIDWIAQEQMQVLVRGRANPDQNGPNAIDTKFDRRAVIFDDLRRPR